MKRYQSYFLFFVALIMVAYFYSYHEIVFKRPQSVHQWRQSDCASIALNYHQGHMNFFNRKHITLRLTEELQVMPVPVKYPFCIMV